MKRRGRPPYPDLLTPRESEVLSLLRQGMSNPEIATRMGISRDGVKYHVSEILSKLGVTSREEAAVWAAPGMPGRRWLPAFLAPAKLFSLKTAGVAVIAVALGALALLALGVLANGRGSGAQEGPILVGLTDPIEHSALTGNPSFFDDLQAYHFIIDVRTGAVLGLKDLCARPRNQATPTLGEYQCRVGRIEWLDDDTLRVEAEFLTDSPTDDPQGFVYEVDLAGRVRRSDEAIKGRLDWPPEPSKQSSNGVYSVVELDQMDTFSELASVVVSGGSHSEDVEIISLKPESAKWSTKAANLAVLGNYCVPGPEMFDLFVFDPDRRQLRNLSSAMSEAVLFYEWSPSGEQIAATGFSFDGIGYNHLMVFDAGGGTPRTLVGGFIGDALVPLVWNPAGTHLVVQYFGGGDWCNGTLFPAAPTNFSAFGIQ